MSGRDIIVRMTVCKVVDHNWASIPYQASEGSGRFLRCLRCGKERHGDGSHLVTII